MVKRCQVTALQDAGATIAATSCAGSYSTCVGYGLHRFSDPAIVRQTRIVEDEPVASL
jgi:hypothetical protein